MRTLFSNRRRLLRWIVGVVFLLLLVVYIGLPTVMAVVVVLPENSSAGNPPDGFSEVTLTTDDDVQLAAWYAEPQNGSVIILVHGAGSGRGSVRNYAMMLQDNGFGVLAINLRGYGDSEGKINRLGWNGTADIGAAVTYLENLDDVESIGALGLSLGGEVLLGAASMYPEIQAVIADGATFRCVKEYTSLPKNEPLVRNFTQRVFNFMVRIFSGDQPPETPLLDSIRAAETTSFLFITAGNDAEEVDYNEYFNETIPDRSQLWIVPDVGHTGGFGHFPEEYKQTVVDFFDEILIR